MLVNEHVPSSLLLTHRDTARANAHIHTHTHTHTHTPHIHRPHKQEHTLTHTANSQTLQDNGKIEIKKNAVDTFSQLTRFVYRACVYGTSEIVKY